MDDPNVKTLNEVLKGEYMAIHAYDDVVDKVTDTNLKDELYRMQQIHQENTLRLSDRIVQLGGSPDGSNGIGGFMADAILRIEASVNTDPQYIIEKLKEGSDKGINATLEVIKGDLDQTSASIVKDILDRDRNNVTRLESLSQLYQ
ncbi:DUF2383 domain-containing protein [Anaerosolibacter sp.]|uniref:DUF2383 domain-containing protein n=1 Tax=Anaerosolibacter sp. TaxID=1872527 RepID=UPI0039F01F4A